MWGPEAVRRLCNPGSGLEEVESITISVSRAPRKSRRTVGRVDPTGSLAGLGYGGGEGEGMQEWQRARLPTLW